MLVDGIDTANEQKIQVVANRWVEKGLYGPSTREYNPLLDLFRNRPYVAERPSIKLSTALANTIQQRLIQKVNAIAIIHETYILERLGGAAYLSIVNSLAPTAEFLFVRERACQLLEQLTEVKL